MGIVTRPYSETDGSIGEASSINTVIDLLYSAVNGELNSANIAASGIAAVNIQDSAIISRHFTNSAVTTSAIADGAVLARALDYEAVILMQEVL